MAAGLGLGNPAAGVARVSSSDYRGAPPPVVGAGRGLGSRLGLGLGSPGSGVEVARLQLPVGCLQFGSRPWDRDRGPAALGLGKGPGSLTVERAAGLRPWAWPHGLQLRHLQLLALTQKTNCCFFFFFINFFIMKSP
jgi:hypothetical protein